MEGFRELEFGKMNCYSFFMYYFNIYSIHIHCFEVDVISRNEYIKRIDSNNKKMLQYMDVY